MTLTTPRTLIREITMDDAPGIYDLDADPLVHQYLGNNPITTMAAAREMTRQMIQRYTDEGIGRWAVTDINSGAFMGWTGFRLITETINGRTGYYDFGYRFIRKYWGQGLATESAIVALDHGVRVLKLHPVHAMTDVNNAASRNVLQKIGFKYVETFPYDSDSFWRKKGEETTWFCLDERK